MTSGIDIYRSTYKQDFSALFRNPPSLFRGAPFWSWNNKLDPDQLCRQIEIFKRMGIGGAHMHCRVGMNTPYLSDEFMEIVKTCVEKAKSEKMLAWLYDEDRWPSGAAGGLVTKDPQFRARHLLFTRTGYEEDAGSSPGNDAGAVGTRAGEGALLARYAITLVDGCLVHYRRLEKGQTAGPDEQIWYAYLQVSQPSSWFNNQTYADTLNAKAIARFVQVTHERYREVVGSDFGGTIPAIFTDEPQFTHKTCLNFSEQQRDITMPFTDDFVETYVQAYGEDLLDAYPEVIWELPDGKPSVTRYRYHDHMVAAWVD